MSHLVVPLEATSTEAVVSILVAGEAPGSLSLHVSTATRPIGDAWTEWQIGGSTRLWSQRVTLDGLEPGRRYPVRLMEGTIERSTGVVGTLPAALPAADEPPFIAMLGSCFAQAKDQEGAAGAAYARLPAGSRPHIKFLCGDQVYLDAPWQKYLANVYGEDDLKTQLFSTYLQTWTQGGDGVGFREILREGANFLTSDDHELWNNAPNATPIVRQTWWPFGDHGRSWREAAIALYDVFQSSSRSAAFRVGGLSFRIVDTRLARTADRRMFMPSDELEALRAWVAALDGPGALVFGQPILVEQTGIKGNIGDWALSDYTQYADLVRILQTSAHDLLVLTGDVHYGRVAGCALSSGRSLIEIIASPFALVDGLVGGTWHGPPASFPAFPIPGATPSSVWVDPGHKLASNHFATLEFNQRGPRVRMTVRAWPIPRGGTAPVSRLVFERDLE